MIDVGPTNDDVRQDALLSLQATTEDTRLGRRSSSDRSNSHIKLKNRLGASGFTPVTWDHLASGRRLEVMSTFAIRFLHFHGLAGSRTILMFFSISNTPHDIPIMFRELVLMTTSTTTCRPLAATNPPRHMGRVGIQKVTALAFLCPLVLAQQSAYGQCGGIGWTGATTCVSGYTCQYSNDYYSQCVPGGSTSTTTKTTTATSTATSTTTTTKPTSTSGPVLAFPGAEGFGRNASGPRGTNGTVYVVTNLNDSGSGSFRDAVSQPNRMVVFAVGGLITIKDRIVVSKNVHIAGQTAPGGGITVYGNGLSYSNANNAITRYIRYRMGKGGDSGKDGITIADGSSMIFDHVSVSWGRDETFSINGDVSDVTISDSIIAQGLETHSCGGLMQTSGGVSIIRTLYTDNKTRNPKVKGKNEFINSVVYNWGSGGGYIAGDSDGDSYANIVANAFIAGPSTSQPPFTRGNSYFHAYVKDNYYDSNKDGSLNGAILPQNTGSYSDVNFQSARYDYPTVNTLLSATDAVAYVAAHAGASKTRDHVDSYLIDTQLKSYGKVGATITDETASPMNGPGPIASGTAPKDTDGDGIPDSWETANGLNPNDRSDAMKMASNGYLNIENYVNSLV